MLQDWKPRVRHESPTYEPAAPPDSHVDSPHAQTSPADAPALESLASSGPMSVVSSAPGLQEPLQGAGPPGHVPLPAPGSGPLHSMPFPHGTGPSSGVPAAPAVAPMAQAASVQQLQAALSAQSPVSSYTVISPCLFHLHSADQSKVVWPLLLCLGPCMLCCVLCTLQGVVLYFVISCCHAGDCAYCMLHVQLRLWFGLQGNVLPAGLDLGSISALAAALGVQSVALPGQLACLTCTPLSQYASCCSPKDIWRLCCWLRSVLTSV